MRLLTGRKAGASVLLAVLLAVAGHARAQVSVVNVDPLVAMAVEAEKEAITNKLEAENKKQLTIVGLNTGIMLQLDSIRKYERKTYEYLSKVHSTVLQAYDIYECGRLLTSIYSNLKGCEEAAVNHPLGAAVTAVVAHEYENILKEAVGIYAYISGLVTQGGEANLLNTAERSRILWNVRTRLSTINLDLWYLQYRIRYARLAEIPAKLEPDIWYDLNACKFLYEDSQRKFMSVIRK